jgi:hypothetical protein
LIELTRPPESRDAHVRVVAPPNSRRATVLRISPAAIIDRLPAESLLRLRTLMTREEFAAQIRELAPAAFESCRSGG